MHKAGRIIMKSIKGSRVKKSPRNMACPTNTNQPMANHKMGEGKLKGLRVGTLTHDLVEGWN